MDDLEDLGIADLRALAKNAGVSAGGSKADIIARLEAGPEPSEDDDEGGAPEVAEQAAPPIYLGSDITVSPIHATLKEREEKADKKLDKLEKRLHKRGSYRGSPH